MKTDKIESLLLLVKRLYKQMFAGGWVGDSINFTMLNQALGDFSENEMRTENVNKLLEKMEKMKTAFQLICNYLKFHQWKKNINDEKQLKFIELASKHDRLFGQALLKRVNELKASERSDEMLAKIFHECDERSRELLSSAINAQEFAVVTYDQSWQELKEKALQFAKENDGSRETIACLSYMCSLFEEAE